MGLSSRLCWGQVGGYGCCLVSPRHQVLLEHVPHPGSGPCYLADCIWGLVPGRRGWGLCTLQQRLVLGLRPGDMGLVRLCPAETAHSRGRRGRGGRQTMKMREGAAGTSANWKTWFRLKGVASPTQPTWPGRKAPCCGRVPRGASFQEKRESGILSDLPECPNWRECNFLQQGLSLSRGGGGCQAEP